MIEWIKNLELEFVILFVATGLLLFLLVLTLLKSIKIYNLIGRRALDLSEDLLHREGIDVANIVIANTSYVNVEVGAVGFFYKKILLPLKEENAVILARDSHKISIPLVDLRAFVIGDSSHIKKIHIYVEDTLGRRTIRKAKNSFRVLKQILRKERKATKKEEKNMRFENGNYLFIERVGLVFKLILSPIVKLFRVIKTGVNRKLKDREIKLEIKRKQRVHRLEMQHAEDEKNREHLLVLAEEKMIEEKRLAVLKSQQEAKKKAADELKKKQDEHAEKERKDRGLAEEKKRIEYEKSEIEKEEQ
ncbi:MAG: hypothetical protein IH571_07670, partial [Acholeplasmataceae bacterium]|nr:hypothetical protein [Acholeplasmataceae bacterium]